MRPACVATTLARVVIRWIGIVLVANYVLLLLLYGRVFFQWW